MLRPHEPRRAPAGHGAARGCPGRMRKQAAAEHTRLQKVMAERGVASRRAAEELIAAGRVRVDGQVVRVLGTKVAPDARIEVDGEPTREVGFRYIALHKPFGVVSTASDERGRRSEERRAGKGGSSRSS